MTREIVPLARKNRRADMGLFTTAVIIFLSFASSADAKDFFASDKWVGDAVKLAIQEGRLTGAQGLKEKAKLWVAKAASAKTEEETQLHDFMAWWNLVNAHRLLDDAQDRISDEKIRSEFAQSLKELGMLLLIVGEKGMGWDKEEIEVMYARSRDVLDENEPLVKDDAKLDFDLKKPFYPREVKKQDSPKQSKNEKTGSSTDITGYGNLRWGDSDETVIAKTNGVKDSGCSFCVGFETIIGGQNFIGKAIIGKNDLEGVVLNGGAQREDWIIPLITALENKYGPSQKGQDSEGDVFKWAKENGYLTLFLGKTLHGNPYPSGHYGVKMLYEKREKTAPINPNNL